MVHKKAEMSEIEPEIDFVRTMKKEKRLTATKAIRKYCVNRCGGTYKKVRDCSDTKCYLYSRRLGYDLNRKKRAHVDFKQGDGGKFIAKNKSHQLTAVNGFKSVSGGIISVSDAIIVSKKKWEELQEKKEAENAKTKDAEK